MSRRSDGLTGELFVDIPRAATPAAGSMDYRTQVAVLVGDMIDTAKARDPELDRSMIAAKISRLVGKDVSKAMLDGYTAESRDAFNTPAYLIPALETACDSLLYTNWLASVRGGRLVLGPATLDAEIGRLQSDMGEMGDRLKLLQRLRRGLR